MTLLLGPVRCHDCHATVYVRRFGQATKLWECHDPHDGRRWRLHVCTALEPTPSEAAVLRHRETRMRAALG